MQLLGVGVVVVEVAAADIDVIVDLCPPCVGSLECAGLRLVNPGPGIPVFGLAGELFEVNF